ncbi:MAG TPA: hypothetical protein VHL98_22705 [Microvirga sp.]|jgi:hypothetical protein|nr:hypothetical protein [Microvirga sp.]
MSALLPLLVAALTPLLVSAAGFTERSLIGTALEEQFYGYFFRTDPLFLFAVVYGVLRILAAAVAEPGGPRALRSFTAPLAAALFLAACLYPTFGGFVLRPGFMTGSMSFLTGRSGLAAALLGAGAAGLVYGLALGLCSALARLRAAFRWRAFGRAAAGFLALWLGAAILLLAPRFGIDAAGLWPAAPLPLARAATAAGLVALALAPHALVTGLRLRTRKPVPS